MSVALDALDDIISILEEEETSAEVKMEQIVAIANDYGSEMLLSQTRAREDAIAQDIPKHSDLSRSENSKPILNETAKAFLRNKAEVEYYQNKLGYSEEEIAKLHPEEKSRHRIKITELYNQYAEEAEDNVPQKVSTLKTIPFKVKRIASSDISDTNEDSAVEQKWRKVRAASLNKELRQLELEMAELERQNKIGSLSSHVRNLTEDRIVGLQEQKVALLAELEKHEPESTK